MSELTNKIRAALTGRTTGLTTAELRDSTKAPEGNLLSSSLFYMVQKGEVIKHKGENRNDSRYSLNPEHVVDGAMPARKRKAKKTRKAPPQRRKTKKAKRAARKPPAPKPTNGRAFLPCITADEELVLISHGVDPVVFSAEQTLAIATLILANFNPA